MQIEGIGTGGQLNRVGVNAEGQLKTRTISASETEHSVDEGDAFQSYTGVLNLSDASRTSILYLKNDDSADIFVTSITIGTGQSTGGSNNIVLIESVGNVIPTDSIVTSGTDIAAYNRNTGASRVFTGVIKKGPTAPASNGVASTGLLGDFTSGRTFDLTTVVPQGGAISVEVTPPVGNTDMDITISVAFHIIEVI